MDVAKPGLADDASQGWRGPRVALLHTREGVGTEEVRASIRSAAQLGFDGVEIVARGRTDGVISRLAEIAAGGLEATARTAVAAALHSPDLEPAIHDTTELLARAAEVNATCLNLAVPPVRSAAHLSDDGLTDAAFTHYQDQLNFAFQLMHRARFAAERSGVALALECASGGGLLSPVELREIVNDANSSSVGVCLDAQRVAEHGCPFDWYETLRHRIHAIRLTDAWTSDAMIGAMRRCGFDRTVILDGPDALEAVRSMLRNAP